mgnify:CR=1 FL=1
MKHLIIILAIFSNIGLFAQTYKMYQTQNIHNQLKLNTKTGEVYQIQDDGQKFLVNKPITPSNEKQDRYILFETKNLWTFILLDQFTGKLWQCQYSASDIDNIMTVVINPDALSKTETKKFTIQPLTSMFQYYLINEDNGEMWKFQWSTKGDEYRWITKM